MAVNETTCEQNCTVQEGHMPYLYEVDSILSQLYVNGSINATHFPIFSEDSWQIRNWASKESSRKFSFHVSTKYDFRNGIWNSGGFEIERKYWAERNLDEEMYPILDDRLLLVQNDHHWAEEDHWGTVDCKNNLFSSFKV